MKSIKLQDLKAKQTPCGMGEPLIVGVILGIIARIKPF